MAPDRLARTVLRADALYCLVVGLGAATFAPLAASTLVLPTALVVAAGVVTALWAGIVWWLSSRPPRISLLLVVSVNTVVALGLATVSAVAAGGLLVGVLLAFAFDIGAFAGVQTFALRRVAAARAT